MLEIRGITITVVDQTGRELKWDDEGVERNREDALTYSCAERMLIGKKMLAVLAVSGLMWVLIVAAVLLAMWVGKP